MNIVASKSATRLENYQAVTTGESLRSQLSLDRWQSFHEGKRVLIVDDNEDTARRVQRELTPLYGRVDIATDPSLVTNLVGRANADGEPFHVVVLDLYMPRRSGMDLLKELSMRESSLALVINTASMMNPAVADLTAKLDGFLARRSLDDGDFALLSKREALVHFKLDGVSDLIAKIDLAQMLAARRSDAMQEFWRTFEPRIPSMNFTAEIVHSFAEHLHNFCAEFAPLWEQVKATPGVRECAWWSLSGTRIHDAFSRLLSTSFSSLLTETPTGTATNVHDVLNQVAQLNPSLPSHTELASFDSLRGVRSVWNELFQDYRKRLNAAYSSLQTHHSPSLDLPTWANLAGFVAQKNTRSHLGGPLGDYALISDPDRSIRLFLERFAELVREKRDADWKSLSIHLTWIPEEARQFEDPKTRALLDGIKAGAFYLITLSFDYSMTSLDAALSPLNPHIASLFMKGLVRLRSQSWMNTERRWQVDLFIKASDRTIDFEARKLERARKTTEGTRVITTEFEEFIATEDLGPDKNLILLGELTEPGSRGQRPILLKLDDTVIFCEDGAHFDGAAKVSQYLAFMRRVEPDHKLAKVSDDWLNPRSIYERCLRLRFTTDGIHMDSLPDRENHDWAFRALEGLGYGRSSISIAPSSFDDKPDYN